MTKMFLAVITVFVFISGVLAADDRVNPAFGGKDNQISLHFGQSLRDSLENLFMVEARYSQPNEFFRIHGRRNMEFITARGASELARYNQNLIFGLSQDALTRLFHDSVYGGINLGIYIKSHVTDRISSRFTFGQRVFLAYKFSDFIAIEAFGRHFSNGTLTAQNSGQNFVGFTVIYNF